MANAYQTAKRVALGLQAEARAIVGDDLWNISAMPGGGSAEMPFQYFEQGFEAPDELLAHRAALSLYPEFNTDQQAAANRLKTLIELLYARDALGLNDFLKINPPAEWLSLVFMDAPTLLEDLIPAMASADDACKKALRENITQELARLKQYKGLLEALLDRL